MSDDVRTKVRSSKASREFTDEVARHLGFKPAELLGVYDNADGPYVVVKDGHRLLLRDDGTVAWYGDEAPNPSYPLVVPSVELDESDEDEDEGQGLVVIGEEGPELVTLPPPPVVDEGGPVKATPPPKHGAGSSRDAWAAYAAEHQVDVSDAVTREQIWHLLEQANIPTG